MTDTLVKCETLKKLTDLKINLGRNKVTHEARDKI